MRPEDILTAFDARCAFVSRTAAFVTFKGRGFSKRGIG